MYLFATLLARKGLFAHSTESLTLTEGVSSNVRVYLEGAKQRNGQLMLKRPEVFWMDFRQGFFFFFFLIYFLIEGQLLHSIMPVSMYNMNQP